MIKLLWKYFFVFIITGIICSCVNKKIIFDTTNLRVEINNKGLISGFIDKNGQSNYLPKKETAPLLSLYKDSAYILPSSIDYDLSEKKITMEYQNGSVAVIGVDNKVDYLRFELLSLHPRNGVEAVVWGPFPTTIDEKIGETICVVRDEEFAIGLQALDINTIEGLPDGDDNAGGGGFIEPLPGQELPDSLKNKIGQKVEVNVNITGDMPEYIRLYRGSAAIKKPYGSELRLFSRDRKIPRVIHNWQGQIGHDQYVEALDVDFIGSAIAMFGCPEPMTLDIIEKIELGEGLPHPMLNGVWIKRSTIPGEAYLLNEGDPMQSLEYAKACGFKLIHIGDFFESWGHFGLLTKRFPKGSVDILKAVEIARNDGISLGVHTLTMFTSKHDPYITPLPSDSLCKTGSSVLSRDVGKEEDVVYIKDPAYFKNMGSTHTVKIGKELINFRKVSEDEPWRLIDCKRGQYGTIAKSYIADTPIDKLTNDSYSGFYPDIKLQDTYAKRLAEVCNTYCQNR